MSDMNDLFSKGMGNSEKEMEPVKWWYDVGNYAVNYILSKKLDKGIPSGRITVIDGLSGCLEENTRIEIVRGRNQKPKRIKIKELYKKFNCLGEKGNWDDGLETKILSFSGEDKDLKLNELIGVIDSGEKKCFKLTTENNKKIVVSEEHPFKVPDNKINGRGIEEKDNFVALKNLKIGEKIMMRDKGKTTHSWEKIKSIEAVGNKHTYDIRMKKPFSNFVAEDFIVHNTGKSLFSCSVAKDKDIDMVLLIDTEGGGVGKELMEYVGVSPEKVHYFKAHTFENYKTNKKTKKTDVVADKDMPAKLNTDTYLYTEGITYLVKKMLNLIRYNKDLADKKIILIIDSIANTQSVRELNGVTDMGMKGQLLNRFFRTFDNTLENTGVAAILTNKLYTNIGNEYVPYVAAGGESVTYNASSILRLTRTSASEDVSAKEIDSNKNSKTSALGSTFNTMNARVIKSRFGTQEKRCDYLLEANSGLVRYSGLFKLLKDYDIIKGGGSWYSCEEVFGESRFHKKDFVPKFKENEAENLVKFQNLLDKKEEELMKKNQERVNTMDEAGLDATPEAVTSKIEDLVNTDEEAVINDILRATE